MSLVTIPRGQYPFSFLGAVPLALDKQPWWSPTTINKIYKPSANNLAYVSGNPANPAFGVKVLEPALYAGDPLPGYVLDVKAAFQIDGTLFGGLPIASPSTPPKYNRVVSQKLPLDQPGESEGVVFRSQSTSRVEFDAVLNTSGDTIQLQITDNTSGVISYMTFPAEYAGYAYTFYRADNSYVTRTFPTGPENFTA